jgi:hypothetical protein
MPPSSPSHCDARSSESNANMNSPTPHCVISTPSNKRKWYVVIVGQQMGIFDDWYVTLVPCGILFLKWLYRLYTNSIVLGVPRNNHMSFMMYNDAQVYYTTNRDAQKVVRVTEEDDAVFSPLDEAMDVNWCGY